MAENFEICTTDKNDYKEIVVKNIKTGEYILVLPEFGARLNKAVLIKGENYHSILREVEPNQFKSQDDIFNNVKLFPFANRIKNGTYNHNGKEYSLGVLFKEENNACHGLVHDKKFVLNKEAANDKFAEVELIYESHGDNEGYPFSFKIFIGYKLTDKGEVICSTKIVNISDEKVLFSDGWHHYFNLDDPVDKLQLKKNVKTIIETDNCGIPTGKKNICTNNEFIELRNQNFDTTYEVNDGEKIITEVYNPVKDIKLSIWQEAGKDKYKYILVYTPVDRKSIAIEPMTSNVNAFNNMDNLLYLDPGKTWESKFGFSINS